MRSVLYPHQVEAMGMLKASLKTGSKRPMLQCPTGFGKTVMAAAIVEGAMRKGNRVMFCVPSLSLIDQTVQAFWREGIRDVGVIQADHPMTDYSKPVQVCSVQTIQRRRLPHADLVLIDEAHNWFKFYEKWFAQWDAIPFVGLSATPWTKGLGKHYDDLIIASTTQELIDAGYLSPFRVFAPSHPDLSGVRTIAGDYAEDDLAGVMNQSQLVADVVETWKAKAEGRPTLCFAVNRAHAKRLQQQFEQAGVPSGYIDAYTDIPEREAVRKQFASGAIKVVCNVGCLTTGVDWDVRCIVLARPTKSEMLFCLDMETEILTGRGWCKAGEIAPGDVAAALDVETGKGVWSRVEATVERDMSADESWIEYEAPRSNFRVTDRHRMYARTRTGEYQFYEASELVGLTLDSVFMRTAVEMEQVGVPLTDHELYFIGMMMADGTWTTTAANISQSERYPEIIERIEACLQGCGIGYSKRRVKPQLSEIIERHPRWVFHFSAGKPKAHASLGRSVLGNECKTEIVKVPGTTGFRHLLPYLDKDFSPALMAMSKPQLLTFLGGLFDGDGFKKRGVDYLPQTKDICTSRKLAADRIQALCAINGINCSVTVEQGARKNPIYVVRIKEQVERSHGGYASKNKPRPQITAKPATNERVWCVQTAHGTIITRRKGKVTVMGNCQIIGRGLRTADGKIDCLILDHSDTHLRLGFVTDIAHAVLDSGKHQDSKSERKEPLPKECAKCSYLKPAKVHECPSCGFKPERQPGVSESAGVLEELEQGSKTQRKNNRTTPAHEKAEFYGGLLGHALSKGYKRGWAANQYREHFGVWPNAHKDASPREPNEAVKSWIRHQNIRYAKRRVA